MAINPQIQSLISSNRALTATDVGNLFYYYYGRPATASEQTYWTNKPVTQLTGALTPNAAQFKNSGYYKDTQQAPVQSAKPNITGTETTYAGGVTIIQGSDGKIYSASNFPGSITSSSSLPNTPAPGYVTTALQQSQSPAPSPTPAPTVPASQSQTSQKATDADVTNLYQQYFGREPSAAELANWGTKGGADTTVSALQNFLTSEQSKYGVGMGGQPATPIVKPDGVPDAVWAGLSDTDKAAWAAIFQQIKTNAAQGNPNPATLTPETMNKLLEQAKKNVDPFYAQQLSIGQQTFNQQLQSIQANLDITQSQQKQQMMLDQKALAEQEAAAGRANSGFRQQAQQQLQNTEQAVIKSTAQTAKDQLQQMGSAFEQQFGTSQLPSAQIGYINPLTGAPYVKGVSANDLGSTYQQFGGITGANEQNKLMAEQTQQNLLAQNALMTANPAPVK